MDIHGALKAMSTMGQIQRRGYHLTLGDAIAALDAAEDGLPVEFDCGGSPQDVSSYRGYYDDLALEPGAQSTPVIKLRQRLHQALGETFHGYKGGEYVMDAGTPLWCAGWGRCGRAVTGIDARGDRVILLTRELND